MAVISDTDVTNMIRYILNEGTAKFWEDDEITLYKKFGMMAVVSKYWYLLAPIMVKVAATSLTANTAYVSQPDDCAKVLRVEEATNRKLLRYIEPDEIWKYSLYDDGAAASNYLNVWYLEYADEVTDFPEAVRPLIAMEAIAFAKAKDENLSVDIQAMHKRFENIAYEFLSSQTMYEPAIFGDYAQERAYTDDNPVAWSFRDGYIYLYKIYDED